MPDLWIDVDIALSEVPVNLFPLIDDTDFKTREVAIVYNEAGMDLVWNFITPAGSLTQTAVTPTTAGTHDWVHVGDGMYSLEIPASAGTINNNLEGFGWFTGVCTGVLPWRGPVIGFRAALLNNLLIEDAFSVTRGLAGTALPAAVADAAGGLTISDAGGLDLDTKLANTNEVTAARMGALTDWIDGGRLDLILDIIAVDTTTDIPALIAALNDPTAATIADAVLDEALSGHTTLGTLGQLLNALGVQTGEVADAGATTTDFDVDGFTEATDDHFNGILMVFTTGALTGQARVITDYTGTGQNCVFGEAWTEAPADNDDFVMIPASMFQGGDLSKVMRLFVTILDQATGQLDSGSLGTSLDGYNAKIEFYDDDGASTDRYEVTWRKNGQAITSGITSPTIQVIKSSDGTDLVASVAMTEVASLGLYKHAETTNRVVAGATYRVKVQATIGGATQTDYEDVGRDT